MNCKEKMLHFYDKYYLKALAYKGTSFYNSFVIRTSNKLHFPHDSKSWSYNAHAARKSEVVCPFLLLLFLPFQSQK